MKISRQVWREARRAVALLHRYEDPDLAAAVERVIKECIQRDHELCNERLRAQRFRDEMRARVDDLTAKVLVALTPDVHVPIPRRRQGGNHR